MARHSLGEFELLVMLASLHLGPDEAYTVSIADVIEARGRRRVRTANVYTAVQRLESKGLVSTRLGESRPERGGKPRRLVTVLPEGVDAVRTTTRAVRELSVGLEDALGGAV